MYFKTKSNLNTYVLHENETSLLTKDIHIRAFVILELLFHGRGFDQIHLSINSISDKWNTQGGIKLWLDVNVS